MKDDELIVETFAVGALGCNCTILGDRARGEAIVIDPGDEGEAVAARVRALGLRAVALVHTHAHIDHINGTAACQEAFGAGAWVHEDDLFLYDGIEEQARMLEAWGLPVRVSAPPTPEGFLRDGLAMGTGTLELGVVHTPGHTPGSVCFMHERGQQPLLFAGDTLFAGSVGRTDLEGGDAGSLARSIRERLYVLPEETLVIPGHGPTTTIGEERRHNGFVRA